MSKIIYSFVFILSLAFAGMFITSSPVKAQPQVGCDDAQCEAAVCSIDPFCCGAFGGFWDGLCVAEANALCPICNADGECPKGDSWTLISLGASLPIDIGNLHDQNEDGYACFRVPKGISQSGSNGQNPLAWVWKDNSKPVNTNCCGAE